MADSQGRVIPLVNPVTTTTAVLPLYPTRVGVAVETQATDNGDVAVWLV
jgi:hypothetical protein